MTGKIKDEEDGLWIHVGVGEFFMYYNNIVMDEDFKFGPALETKVVYEEETLVIPYEFL